MWAQPILEEIDDAAACNRCIDGKVGRRTQRIAKENFVPAAMVAVGGTAIAGWTAATQASAAATIAILRHIKFLQADNATNRAE